MGWFWADKVAPTSNNNNNNNNNYNNNNNNNNNNISACPVMHNTNESACPVMHNTGNNSSGSGSGVNEQYSHGDSDVPAGLNPLNYIPKDLSPTETQPGQKLTLTTNKTISSIPRGEQQGGKWEYPSAQQMYNAMVRKGKIGSQESLNEDTVEAMVQIHNFLNESCWYEILRWEKPYTEKTHLEPKLLKFMGKPGVLTPRARFNHYLGYIFPWYFSGDLPFDRHDWIVLRGEPNNNTNSSAGTTEPKYTQVRYVLDFYGGPDDANGMPTFSVDVRPALDNFTNVKDRFNHFTSSILSKLSKEEK